MTTSYRGIYSEEISVNLTARVQIFIPTYNRAQQLKRAIYSCLNQTYGLVEVVVLDNCSTDDTQEICVDIAKRDPRLLYKKNAVNIGMLRNFNLVHKLVSADYFCMLPDDDVYMESFIKNAISLIFNQPDVMAVAMNGLTRRDGKILSSQLDDWEERKYSAGEGVHLILRGHWPLITNTLFRSIFAKDFIFPEELGGGGDIFIVATLFANHNVIISKRVSGYYDLHKGNHTLIADGVEIIKNKLHMRDKLMELLPNMCSSDFDYFKVSTIDALQLFMFNSTLESIKNGREELKHYLGSNVRLDIIFWFFSEWIVFKPIELLVQIYRNVKSLW